MKVSYNKLWKLLIDRKMSKADLRKAVEMSPNTMTKMRRDEEVAMSVLLKIATYLDCDISDICEFVKEKNLTIGELNNE
ncbi:MAG: helix-turn-helix transcriptional regulator [Anaerostipes sp.]|nr:helix-turn-helix transcriptional regulator [Anaerostipes sp.]